MNISYLLFAKIRISLEFSIKLRLIIGNKPQNLRLIPDCYSDNGKQVHKKNKE